MQDQHDLILIFESRVPLVALETHDELRFIQFHANPVVSGSGRYGGEA